MMLRKIYLSADTLVYTTRGYKPLFDLSDREQEVMIWCRDGFQEMAVKLRGDSNGYLVRFDNGCFLTCGAQHQWVTGTGMCVTSQLVVGTTVIQDQYPRLDIYNEKETLHHVPLNSTHHDKLNCLAQLKDTRMTSDEDGNSILTTFDQQFLRYFQMMLSTLNIYSKLDISDVMWSSKLTVYEQTPSPKNLKVVEVTALDNIQIYDVFTTEKAPIAANGMFV